jgi:hypothetical protein
MPQFDTFIFSSSLFYFILSFLIVLYGNYAQFLPRLGALLKLRHKITHKAILKQASEVSLYDLGFSYSHSSSTLTK